MRDITIKGITFRGAAKTMLSPHESTNSGADWAAPRRAAVAIEGTRQTNTSHSFEACLHCNPSPVTLKFMLYQQ